MREDKCIFCKIINKEIESYVVYEDEFSWNSKELKCEHSLYELKNILRDKLEECNKLI